MCGKRGKSGNHWKAREKLPSVASAGKGVTCGKPSAGRDVTLGGKIYHQGDICCIAEMEWQPEGKRNERQSKITWRSTVKMKSADRRSGPKSGAGHKTGLVGEQELHLYRSSGAESGV